MSGRSGELRGASLADYSSSDLQKKWPLVYRVGAGLASESEIQELVYAMGESLPLFIDVALRANSYIGFCFPPTGTGPMLNAFGFHLKFALLRCEAEKLAKKDSAFRRKNTTAETPPPQPPANRKTVSKSRPSINSLKADNELIDLVAEEEASEDLVKRFYDKMKAEEAFRGLILKRMEHYAKFKAPEAQFVLRGTLITVFGNGDSAGRPRVSPQICEEIRYLRPMTCYVSQYWKGESRVGQSWTELQESSSNETSHGGKPFQSSWMRTVSRNGTRDPDSFTASEITANRKSFADAIVRYANTYNAIPQSYQVPQGGIRILPPPRSMPTHPSDDLPTYPKNDLIDKIASGVLGAEKHQFEQQIYNDGTFHGEVLTRLQIYEQRGEDRKRRRLTLAYNGLDKAQKRASDPRSLAERVAAMQLDLERRAGAGCPVGFDTRNGSKAKRSQGKGKGGQGSKK